MLPAALTATPVSSELSMNSSICEPAHVHADAGCLRDAARKHVEVTAEQAPATVATASSDSSHSQRSVRDRSPSSQNTMPRSAVSSLSASSRLTMEPAPAATTTPVSSSRVGVQPPGPWASAKTSRHAPKAPSAAAPSTPRQAGRP